MIAIDPTEARSNSRLPKAVQQAAIQVQGLEHFTGADLLVSPLRSPKLPAVLTQGIPHQKALREHTEAGVLIQRKDGQDLLSSIPHLADIERRMLEWCGAMGPWLLVIGQFEERKDGAVYIGRKWVSTSFNYQQITAALDWWQLRGGHVTQLHSANKIAGWLARWHESTFRRLGEDKVIIDRPPVQAVRYEEHWWAPLTGIRGLGPQGAQAIAEFLPKEYQTLNGALHYLTTASLQKALGRPQGIGKKTLLAVREWLGLSDGEFVVTLDGGSGATKERIEKLHHIMKGTAS